MALGLPSRLGTMPPQRRCIHLLGPALHYECCGQVLLLDAEVQGQDLQGLDERDEAPSKASAAWAEVGLGEREAQLATRRFWNY